MAWSAVAPSSRIAGVETTAPPMPNMPDNMPVSTPTSTVSRNSTPAARRGTYSDGSRIPSATCATPAELRFSHDERPRSPRRLGSAHHAVRRGGRGRHRGDRAAVRRVPRGRRDRHRRARHDRRDQLARGRREASSSSTRSHASAPPRAAASSSAPARTTPRTRSKPPTRSRAARPSSARSSSCRTTCGRRRQASSRTTARSPPTSPVPVVVYNIPTRTGRGLGAASLLELARTPNIAGVKQAVATLDADTLEVLAARRPVSACSAARTRCCSR